MHAAEPRSSVRYAFDRRPETGETMRVAPGVFWLRMHLPFSLSHINLWLLEDGDGLSLIHISEPTRQLMSSRMPSSA